MRAIPALPGAYILCLYLARGISMPVGKIGKYFFPQGTYLYLGSARGPGGLQARLGRHLTGQGRRHWHIDYLRSAVDVAGFAYVTQEKMTIKGVPLECRWSQTMLSQPGASAPAPGFGASDCRWGCLAHLVFVGFEGCELGGWVEI